MTEHPTLYLVDAPCDRRHFAKLPLSLIVTTVPDLSPLSDLKSPETRWALAACSPLPLLPLPDSCVESPIRARIAGALICFVLYVGGGPGALAALITVFGLAWITTRLGYPRKQRLGTAERSEGRKASRSWPTSVLLPHAPHSPLYAHNRPPFLLAMTAALSEAAADTVSSELGQAFSRKAYLITSWRPVPPGTNGAVSLVGTLAGLAAAGIVSTVCVLGGLLPWQWLAVSAGTAALGMVTDSFLGAWLERRGLVNNDSVNLLGTLAAALAAFCLA